MRAWASVVPLLAFPLLVVAAGWEDGARWGRVGPRPKKSNHAFATADGCALCHSAHPRAAANRSPAGEDVSPHGLWRGTMMANAFRDPYWRAQVAREMAASPGAAAETQALCLRCHGPMASHTARLKGEASPAIRLAAFDPMARDGVSCTVCHQAKPDRLGRPESFNGRLDIALDRKIYGPYDDPFFQPMLLHSDYRATPGPHIRKSELCASCHTLDTGHFQEQTPFFEWRNSAHTGTTCQECHMAQVGPVRIARTPGGRDFDIPPREDVRAHAFVGANTFMLRMLRENREDLGVTAPAEALERIERATRRFLSTRAARLTIDDPARADGEVRFAVRVENLAGHKLPTGYPARRAWLRVEVRQGDRVLFSSGGFDDEGRIRAKRTGHFREITAPDQAQVYELRATDADGEPTTSLLRMANRALDNRLLPRGWKPDGPHADATRPVGTDGDDDFRAGSDTVRFRVPAAGNEPVEIEASLHYQSIPPHWVEPLRSLDAAEAKLFLELYAKANKAPETLARASRSAGR